MTKSEFIRKNPHLSAIEIHETAKRAGLDVSTATVYTVRGRDLKNGGAPARGRGRPRKHPLAVVAPLPTKIDPSLTGFVDEITSTKRQLTMGDPETVIRQRIKELERAKQFLLGLLELGGRAGAAAARVAA
jgi:hypothetical protein